MKSLAWGLLLLCVLIIQATILPLFAIKGIRPDLLLIIVVSSALLLGKEQGVGLGFFAGLLQDLASGNIFGLNVLSKMATGYLAGVMEQKVFKEKALLPILAVSLASIFNGIVSLLILSALGYSVAFSASFVSIFYGMLYNAVLAIPVHHMVHKIATID